MSASQSHKGARRAMVDAVTDIAHGIHPRLATLFDVQPMAFVGRLDRRSGTSVEVMRGMRSDVDRIWLDVVQALVDRFGRRASKFHHVYAAGDEPVAMASHRLPGVRTASEWLRECTGSVNDVVGFVMGLDVDDVIDDGFPLNEVTLFDDDLAILELSDHGRIVRLFGLSEEDIAIVRAFLPVDAVLHVTTASTSADGPRG